MTHSFLQFDGIEKSFFGVSVLRGISFTVERGQVLGLVGENGAGKSTLMNILGGVLRAEAGTMRLNGNVFKPKNPADAMRHGIAFIHQELNLFANLSVAENLFINDFPQRRWAGFSVIDRRTMRKKASALLATLELDFSPDTIVENLAPGERQMIEIAKALSAAAQIIIFDEPTTSLTARETAKLFALIERLRTAGIAMIYISHALSEVMQLCDRVVVLRDGVVVGTGAKTDFTIDQMITLMVGRKLNQLFPVRTAQPSAEIALAVRDLSQPGIVKDISFTLHKGEVLGVSGLMGSGRTELGRILFGLDPFSQGEIVIHGEKLSAASARQNIQQRINHGLAFLTEDRRTEGLMMEASIADNIALAALPSFLSTGTMIDRTRLQTALTNIAETVQLRSANMQQQRVKQLSGGNQQKAVLAKWLLTAPQIFILDEPTRGIDVGAKYEIYRLINELAERGASVLLISSEIEELIGMCDRLLVMRQGEITDCIGREDFAQERILRGALQTSVPQR